MKNWKEHILTCEDNMQLMARYPDNYFELAIVDPPYGIGFGEYNRTNKASDGTRYKSNKYKNGNWDSSAPSQEYFNELFRVSKNQIVWGFNHFLDKLTSTKAVIFWYKHQNGHFAEGELAWCSIGTVKYYDRAYQKDIGNKIHPTQKPVALYKWLLTNYAKEGDKILDTHLGSFSSVIACLDMGFEITGCELDQEYFENGMKRVSTFKQQLKLF